MSTTIRQQLSHILQKEYPQAKPIMHSVLLAIIVALSNVGVETTVAAPPGQVDPGQVGNGFTVTAADLAYILKQIKIAEAHVAAGPGTTTDPDNCQALIGNGPNQIPTPLLSFGLRTVNGACNNLQASQHKHGAADEVFPRLATPVFKPAEDASAFHGPANSTYAQTSGMVADSHPRTVSNLIVDQTSSNPAAIYVAEHPARAQADPDRVFACSAHPELSPPDCVPDHQTLFIPNITTDVGLSPPFNSLFTIFGQFFDHGLGQDHQRRQWRGLSSL